jgi:beta-lactamase superfamily II metal-dependent hydrolase
VTEVFHVEMLPARKGDCVVLAYGDSEHPRRILIDGGRAATYRTVRDRFSQLSEVERTFELLIVSHIDRDHIEGAVAMLEDPTGVQPGSRNRTLRIECARRLSSVQ